MFGLLGEDRVKRYLRKLEHFSWRLSQVSDWISKVDEDVFVRNEMRKLATYKAFQEAVESAMDIVAMICRDEGLVPGDDFTNVENLEKRGILSGSIAGKLLEGNRSKNVLVRCYNKIDDSIALESIKEILPLLSESHGVVEKWLKRKSSG